MRNLDEFQVARELNEMPRGNWKKCRALFRRSSINKKAVKILQDFGFKQYSRSILMRFGEKLQTERVDGILAIGDPEKG